MNQTAVSCLKIQRYVQIQNNILPCDYSETVLRSQIDYKLPGSLNSRKLQIFDCVGLSPADLALKTIAIEAETSGI